MAERLRVPPGHSVVVVPNPSRGNRYMMMQLDQGLVEATTKLIANGTAETELQARLEACIRDFLASQPIDVHLPANVRI